MRPSISQIENSTIWHDIAKCLQEGLLILNHSNVIEFANASARRILGIASDAPLEGLLLEELKVPLEPMRQWFHGLAGKEHTETHYRDKKGNSARVIRGGADSPFRIIVLSNTGCSSNAAQTMMARAESLEKSNHELDQFAYIVSHDLKAPLRAISNLSTWLEEDLRDSLSGDNLDMLKKLKGRVVRMESLINGILEYSKVGRAEMPSETVDTNKLVREVVELLAPPAHIDVTVEAPLPVVVAPRTMMFQVFANLISNAIKYNDKTAGIIRISGHATDSHFEFAIEDNGPGIAEEYHEKIFMIFQTLQPRDKFESTGIGLTIVKRILEARGGSIRVESPAGGGSRFVFTWPTL